MKSHEVFRKLFKKVSPKQIAPEVGVSESTLHKWSEDGESHRANPLERITALVRATNDLSLLRWLCEQHNGYFVHNPAVKAGKPLPLLPAENKTVGEFGDLLSVMTRAVRNNCITRKEAAVIRSRWEELKCVTEGFVSCCERGNFDGVIADGHYLPRTTGAMNQLRV